MKIATWNLERGGRTHAARRAQDDVLALLAADVNHCIGGLGRSGVIAGCLLRALDVAPDDALRRLVAARGKRCPELPEQRSFVRSFSLHS